MFTLEITHPNGQVEHRQFSAYPVVLGRQTGTLVLADPGLSSRHGQFQLANNQLQYEDLGSTNGSFTAHGQRLTQALPLQVGDLIAVGSLQLRVTAFTPPAPAVTPRPESPKTMMYDFGKSSPAPKAAAPLPGVGWQPTARPGPSPTSRIGSVHNHTPPPDEPTQATTPSAPASAPSSGAPSWQPRPAATTPVTPYQPPQGPTGAAPSFGAPPAYSPQAPQPPGPHSPYPPQTPQVAQNPGYSPQPQSPAPHSSYPSPQAPHSGYAPQSPPAPAPHLGPPSGYSPQAPQAPADHSHGPPGGYAPQGMQQPGPTGPAFGAGFPSPTPATAGAGPNALASTQSISPTMQAVDAIKSTVGIVRSNWVGLLLSSTAVLSLFGLAGSVLAIIPVVGVLINLGISLLCLGIAIPGVAATMLAQAQLLEGQEITWKENWKTAFRMPIERWIAVGIAGLLTSMSAIFFVIPAIILYSFLAPALFLEQLSPIEALKRSAQLFLKAPLPALVPFGVVLIASIPVYAIMFGFTLIAAAIASGTTAMALLALPGTVLSTVVGCAIALFVPLHLTRLYLGLRATENPGAPPLPLVATVTASVTKS